MNEIIGVLKTFFEKDNIVDTTSVIISTISVGVLVWTAFIIKESSKEWKLEKIISLKVENNLIIQEFIPTFKKKVRIARIRMQNFNVNRTSKRAKIDKKRDLLEMVENELDGIKEYINTFMRTFNNNLSYIQILENLEYVKFGPDEEFLNTLNEFILTTEINLENLENNDIGDVERGFCLYEYDSLDYYNLTSEEFYKSILEFDKLNNNKRLNAINKSLFVRIKRFLNNMYVYLNNNFILGNLYLFKRKKKNKTLIAYNDLHSINEYEIAEKM